MPSLRAGQAAQSRFEPPDHSARAFDNSAAEPSLRAGQAAKSRFEPPDYSVRAFDESAAERASYEARFKSLNRPEFSNKFLDVDQATRVLLRTRRRDSLCCELFFYTVLVVLYAAYVLKRVSPLTAGFNLGIDAHISLGVSLVLSAFPVYDVSYLNTSSGGLPVPVNLSRLWVQSVTSSMVRATSTGARSGWCELPFSLNASSSAAADAAGAPVAGINGFVAADAAGAPVAGINSSGFAPCVLTPRFLNFKSVRSISEVYAWLRSVAFGPLMFPPGAATSAPNRSGDGWMLVSTRPLGYTTGSDVVGVPVLENGWVPMGAMRLRQVRVRAAPCDLSCTGGAAACANCSLPLRKDTMTTTPFVASSQKTYPYLSEEELARSSISFPRNNVTNEVTTLTVSANALIASARVVGQLANYPGGGYVIDVQMGNYSAGRAALVEIETQRWIDAQTAALFVNYNLYSKNADSYASVSFLIEMSAFGPVFTSHAVSVYQLGSASQQQQEDGGVALLVLSSLLLIYILAQIVADLRARSDQQDVWRRRWALYDVLNLGLVISSIAMRLDTYANSTTEAVGAPDTALVLSTSQRHVYVDFYHRLGVTLTENKLVTAVSLAICFLKFFKYVDLNKRFSIALNSIIAARRWVASWLVMALVLVLSLALYLQFSYGTFSARFGGFGRAVQTTVLYVFQVFNVDTIHSTKLQQLLLISDVPFYLPMVAFGARSFPGIGAATAEPAFFLTLFALTVTISLYGVFQAIIIFGYQVVAQEVLEEDNLALEQHELVRRSERGAGGDGWCTWAGRRARRMCAYREVDTVISRLRTAPETQFRNLLSFEEVLAIVEDTVQPQERAFELSVELMTIFQTPLSRIADAAVLFQERTQAITQGRSSFEVAAEDLPTITAAQSATAFDPTARERWIGDLLSGDLVQSLLLVHCLQLEASEKAFLKRLRHLDTLQDAVADETIAIERAVEALETALRLRYGEAAKQDPWAPRRETAVEADQDGAFEAHHVDANGTHRYLGSFTTPALAQQAIDKLERAARPPPMAQREPGGGVDAPAAPDDDGDGDGDGDGEPLDNDDAASARSDRSDRS
jgi:hypothetical protein